MLFRSPECKLGNKVGMRAHRMDEIMFVRARLVDIPKRLTGEFFNCSMKRFDINYSAANSGKKSEIIALSHDYWPSTPELEALKMNIR